MSADASRVAAVIGASSGIGKATADLLEREGYLTIRVSRTIAPGARARRCDVRDEPAVAALFADLRTQFDRLDVLVNSAAIVTFESPLESTADTWMSVLETNLVGTFLTCKYAIPVMQQRRYGRIVNVSSIAARDRSETASIAYTASKYGVVGLTRQLASDVAADGITVNCVRPSQTNTEMLASVPADRRAAITRRNASGRLAEPSEVASAIAFLASPAASYINGAVLDVNGGGIRQ